MRHLPQGLVVVVRSTLRRSSLHRGHIHQPMSEGLQVVIKYNPLKFWQSNDLAKEDWDISVVMHDLQLLRVHLPSRKNVQRQGETVTLVWPMARRGPKNHNNTLYTRWVKISRNDHESVQLRESLMM
ncbi:hypothetical protein V8B97DRAFT_668332 [Scleroderma yunnanense]